VKPVDWVILCLVFVVGATMTAPVYRALFEGVLDVGYAKIVGGIVTSMVAIISLYVGAKLNGRDDD